MLIYSSKQMVLIYADISLLRQIDTYFIHTYTYVVYIWIFFSGGGGGESFYSKEMCNYSSK